MKYSKLILTVAVTLALSVHSSCSATTVAGMASAEGEQNAVTLLQDSGGNVGEILITTAGGSAVLSSANQIMRFSPGTPPPPPISLTPGQMQQLYGSAIDSRPGVPSPNDNPSSPPNPVQPPPLVPGPGQFQPSPPSPPPPPAPVPFQPPLPPVLVPSSGPGPGPGSGSSSGSGPIEPTLAQALGALSQPPPSFPTMTTFLPNMPVLSSGQSSSAVGNSLNDQNMAAATNTINTQNNMTAANAAQAFFAHGLDSREDLLEDYSHSDFVFWGPWSTPRQSGQFTQFWGLAYTSTGAANMTIAPSGTAMYTGPLRGSAAYNDTSATITTDIAMNVNFSNNTLNFSGGGISGNGSWSPNSAAISGNISYNGTLNNLSANLAGNFAGSFFGNIDIYPAEVGAAWAMSGTVGTNMAHAAGILTAHKD